MRTGAGRYIQGPKATAAVGQEMRRLGYHKIGVICGKRAYEATCNVLPYSLNDAGLLHDISFYSGFCSSNDIDDGSAWAKTGNYDCLLGVGGGKIMDYSKAIGAQVGLPVFTMPTIASTCAAFAPLSVIYDENGCQQSIRFHEDSVAGVFVDLDIIASAPSRYLAAGIADSFAKYCEYTSMLNSVSYNDIDFGRFIGASLACTCDEVLFQCARKAFADNQAQNVSVELNDTVACIIGVIGVVSGFGAFSKKGASRFAIAHGLNELVRGRQMSDPSKYLHGEVVGVGVLAQARANKQPKEHIDQLERLFQDLELPTRLSEIDLEYSDADLITFIDGLAAHCHIGPAFHARIVDAVTEIR